MMSALTPTLAVTCGDLIGELGGLVLELIPTLGE